MWIQTILARSSKKLVRPVRLGSSQNVSICVLFGSSRLVGPRSVWISAHGFDLMSLGWIIFWAGLASNAGPTFWYSQLCFKNLNSLWYADAPLASTLTPVNFDLCTRLHVKLDLSDIYIVSTVYMRSYPWILLFSIWRHWLTFIWFSKFGINLKIKDYRKLMKNSRSIFSQILKVFQTKILRFDSSLMIYFQ